MGSQVGCLRGFRFVVLAKYTWLSSADCQSGFFTVHDVLSFKGFGFEFAIARLEAKERSQPFVTTSNYSCEE